MFLLVRGGRQWANPRCLCLRTFSVFAIIIAYVQGDQLSQTALDELAASGELSDRSVYFDYDSYVIKSDFEGLIGNHAAFINKNNAAVVVYGNADYRGSHEYNLALGQKRAVAVKQALEALGVNGSAIETVSFGEEHANQECTGSTCGQDRRSDIGYVGE